MVGIRAEREVEAGGSQSRPTVSQVGDHPVLFKTLPQKTSETRKQFIDGVRGQLGALDLGQGES